MTKPKPNSDVENRSKLITQFSGHTRFLAFLFVIFEAAFAGVIALLPAQERLWAFVIFSAILAGASFLTLRMMQPAKDGKGVVLDPDRTKEFFRLYQRGLAYAISKVIDDTLVHLQQNPRSYVREQFIERIWRETQKCREEVVHFYNPILGSLHEHFSSSFPREALEHLIVTKYEAMLLDSETPPIDRRRNLFEAIDTVQTKLRNDAIQLLDEKRKRRKGHGNGR